MFQKHKYPPHQIRYGGYILGEPVLYIFSFFFTFALLRRRFLAILFFSDYGIIFYSARRTASLVRITETFAISCLRRSYFLLRKKGIPMLNTIESVNSVINNFIWGVPAMICIIGVGLYLSVGLRFCRFANSLCHPRHHRTYFPQA